MIRTLQSEFEALKRDILELKTAQTKPSIIQAFYKTGTVLPGFYTYGDWTWTINYKNDGSNQAPITMLVKPFRGAYLQPYSNNQQKILFRGDNSEYYQDTMILVSTREIQSITQDQTPVQHEWTQIRAFYPSAMGTTPGWCLQNSREGFLIPYGTFPTARADMESQQANGTLHSGTPPDYIAVPIYFANYNITVAGHVAVWDHGTVWSDGVQFPSIDSVTNSYVGWGELCDGARVVQHI